jgi:hypothetical protein
MSTFNQSIPASNKADFVHNKIFTSRNNVKTRMCKNILEKGECPFGDKCRFAHSESEIRKAPCAFQKNCKNPRCPYSHDDNEELEKVITQVEDTMSKLALYEKECKDLVVVFDEEDEETEEERFEKVKEKIEEDIKYEVKYYENVALKLTDESAIYDYLKTYEEDIKKVNTYSINLTMNDYDFKKLMYYLNSTNVDFSYEKTNKVDE